MQYRFFKIPAAGDPEGEAAFNRFLRGVRVLRVERQFVPDGQAAYWSLCVEYLRDPHADARQGRPEPRDYKEVLAPEDFALFARLRDLRKTLANEEAVPAYAVCTNEQLAELATKRPSSEAALRAIEGFGEAKAKKYGRRFLELVVAASRPPAEPRGKEES